MKGKRERDRRKGEEKEKEIPKNVRRRSCGQENEE